MTYSLHYLVDNFDNYSLSIIIAGSIGSIILQIDTFMISQYLSIDQIAYYSVALFIATVIAVPARAMHQITNPLTSRLISEKNWSELQKLYQKSALTLFVISSFIFVLIVTNVEDLFLMMPKKNYTTGINVVYIIV